MRVSLRRQYASEAAVADIELVLTYAPFFKTASIDFLLSSANPRPRRRSFSEREVFFERKRIIHTANLVKGCFLSEMSVRANGCRTPAFSPPPRNSLLSRHVSPPRPKAAPELDLQSKPRSCFVCPVLAFSFCRYLVFYVGDACHREKGRLLERLH